MIHRLADGELIEELSFAGHVRAVRFSPTEDLLAVGTFDGGLSLRGPAGAFGVIPSGEANPSVYSVAFAKDGTLLAAGRSDGTVVIQDVQAIPRDVRTLEVANDGVVSVAFCPTTGCLAAGTLGGELILLDPRTGVIAKRVIVHDGPVESISFHPEGSVLATVSWDASSKLWSIQGPCE